MDKTKNLEKYIFEQLEILDFLKIPHENYEKIE